MLGIDKTEFRECKQILDSLKPLYELWNVANNFRVLMVEWFEEPIEKLDSSIMENQIEEWLIELRRLQKSEIVLKNTKPVELLKYIGDCLDYIKKYQTLVRITRVKGLTSRHWRQINAELGITIDPYTSTLIRMIGMELTLESRLK